MRGVDEEEERVSGCGGMEQEWVGEDERGG